MKENVLVFGAGAIGRGLIGDIAAINGFSVTFIEKYPELIQELVTAGTYNVRVTGGTDEIHKISEYNILEFHQKKAVAEAITKCSFIATAVGGANLQSIAGLIAEGIKNRDSLLNVLVCENIPQAETRLAEELIAHDCDKNKFSCIPCSVERMAKSKMGSMDIVTESGQSVYVDSRSWLGPKPKIPELIFCDNIEAYYKRKLYTNNAGHALLAYEGYLSGRSLLYETLEIPQIRRDLSNLLDVASKALIKKYGFTPDDMKGHVFELINGRFPNRELADTVKRVARDPLRKLGPKERLVGLANLLLKYELQVTPVAVVIAAALKYRDQDDKSSKKLSDMINEGGVEWVLKKICGFKQGDPCYQDCLNHFYKVPKYI